MAQIHAGASEEGKSYLQRVGFKDVGGLLSHAISLEKTLGADRATILRIPNEGRAESPAAWRDVDAALGVPSDGNYGEYKPSQGEMQATQEHLKAFDAAMAQAGATKAVRNAALDVFHKINDEVRAAYQNEITETMAQASQELQRQWGVAYAEKERSAATALNGLDGEKELGEVLTQFGLDKHPALTRIKAAIAELRSEAGPPPTGEGATTQSAKLTPEQARAQIAELEADPGFMKRYLVDGDAAAIQQMLDLNTAAVAAQG